MGQHVWLLLATIATELLAITKWGQGQFPEPLPTSVRWAWTGGALLLVLYPTVRVRRLAHLRFVTLWQGRLTAPPLRSFRTRPPCLLLSCPAGLMVAALPARTVRTPGHKALSPAPRADREAQELIARAAVGEGRESAAARANEGNVECAWAPCGGARRTEEGQTREGRKQEKRRGASNFGTILIARHTLPNVGICICAKDGSRAASEGTEDSGRGGPARDGRL